MKSVMPPSFGFIGIYEWDLRSGNLPTGAEMVVFQCFVKLPEATHPSFGVKTNGLRQQTWRYNPTKQEM